MNLLKIHEFQVENGYHSECKKEAPSFVVVVKNCEEIRTIGSYVVRTEYVPAFALSHIKFSKGLKEHITAIACATNFEQRTDDINRHSECTACASRSSVDFRQCLLLHVVVVEWCVVVVVFVASIGLLVVCF